MNQPPKEPPKTEQTPAPVNSSILAPIFNKPQPVPVNYDFKPRTKGRAETSPAYDGMLKIQSVPFPEQCLAWTTEIGKYCKCLTDQHTPYEMHYEACLAYAKGAVYNLYQPSQHTQQQLEQKPQDIQLAKQ